MLVIPQQPNKIKSYQLAPSHTVGLDHSNRGKAYAGSVLDVEINLTGCSFAQLALDIIGIQLLFLWLPVFAGFFRASE